MNQKLVPFLPASVLLVGVLFISGVREQYVTKPALPMDSLPSVYEGVTGKNVEVPMDQQKIAGMDQYMYREYRVDSATMFSTYVGYYNRQVQGKSIHSPKNCLPGAGWDIMENAPINLNASDAASPLINRTVLANKGNRALVYYWYQGRGRIASNEYRVKWDLLRDAALYGRTEEALVRIIIFVPPAPVGKDTKVDSALFRADSLARRVAFPLSQSVFKVLPPFRTS